MVSPAPRWPNVENRLAAWITAKTTRPVFTETNTELEDHLPAYKIARVGGSGGLDFDKIIQVEVETIAATRPALWDAVADVETAMFQLAANGTPGAWYVDNVTETFAAAIQESDNGSVRRASATYGLTLRPQ